MNNATKVHSLEDSLDATRIRLYERTKNMTAAERVDFFNQGARDILVRHGVKAKFAETAEITSVRKQANS
jgi:hypothetical protein